MKPKPSSTPESTPAYPSRREFIKRFGFTAVGAAVGALAAGCDRQVGPPGLPPRTMGDVSVAPRGNATFCAETFGKEVDAQIKLLRSTDLETRSQAVADLVTMAKAEGDDEAVADKKRALTLDRLKKLKPIEDKDLSGRVKSIIATLGPPQDRVEIPGSVAPECDPVK